MNSSEVGQLNRLIVACHDDSRIFDEAASAHPKYYQELTELARRRDTFIRALTGVLLARGEAAPRRGSALAWWNRVAASVRVALAGTTNVGDTFRSCVRQETRTLDDYERAAKAGSSSSEVGELVQTQLDEIEADLERVRFLHGWS